MNGLLYLIADQMLVGDIEGTHFQMRAVSGGRAGTKTPGAENEGLANNPYLSWVKKGPNPIGGPLPCGSYTLRLRPSKTNWIDLIPENPHRMWGRDGFAIHGRGPRGSDGCIVPMTPGELVKLVAAVGAAKTPVTLTVIAGEIHDRA
jgi:hypothetical protein